MSAPAAPGPFEGVLFDLDDVLVPFQTPAAWQWAWRPQGPILGERHVRAMIRRSLRRWDRRRWEGAIGKAPPADLAALREHLAETLTAIAGRPLPAAETEAVVRRFLRPHHEAERFPDVPPALAQLATQGLKVGVLTPLPLESARWLLKRAALPETLLLGSGDDAGKVVPAAAAFRSTAEGWGIPVERVAFVGDLFWSDVRSAHRAGLRGVLLDRADAWPDVQGPRIATLAQLGAALESAGSAEPTASEPGPD
jgi:putative hydrolase of the HAD superfamily